MKNIFLAILINNLFGFTYNVIISPDTLYAGSILKIQINIDNLNIYEVPIFYDLDKNDNYTQINKQLTKSSIIYELQFWEIGDMLLPPIKLKINNKGESEYYYIQTDTIKVNSYLSNSDLNLKNIKNIKNINLHSKYKIIFLVIIIILGLFITIYIIKNRSNKIVALYSSGNYIKSPLKIALSDIKSLKVPMDINKENACIYYLNLSVILKKYINSVFYIRASEMTTTEITQYFTSQKINKDILLRWESIIQKLDNVKYANKIPLAYELNENVLELIEIIKILNNIKE
tara:strand:+ start:9452 stop:10315 length:864 start_codon:yes stop_codon:yes gene_type:complete